ncbi:hypothetical protein EV139_2032 [Leucobacter luti]|uniref:SpaA-like prealbumin fold domain-containing protein n=1 Tax=Leucobacter luti TaxID=340320 RepID=A0A4Q7TY13_9MICO|nr:hypothetical protein EV139_2032 [Leucobacter luti]
MPPIPHSRQAPSEISNIATTRWGWYEAYKVDGVTGAGLAGAKFEVYPAADPYGERCVATPLAGSGPIEVVENGATVTEFTSDTNGRVFIPGLFIDQDPIHPFSAYRCYVLKETLAPVGYDLPYGSAAYTPFSVTPGAPGTGTTYVPKRIPNTRLPWAMSLPTPIVVQATCPVPGQPTVPSVMFPPTANIRTVTMVGEVKAGSTVTVRVLGDEEYVFVQSAGWTITKVGASFMGEYTVKFDAIDCEKPPVKESKPHETSLAVTGGSDMVPLLRMGVGAILLLGAAVFTAAQVTKRRRRAMEQA